jgi:hypothetical protein
MWRTRERRFSDDRSELRSGLSTGSLSSRMQATAHEIVGRTGSEAKTASPTSTPFYSHPPLPNRPTA